MYKGIGASSGVAIGKAFVIEKKEIVFEEKSNKTNEEEIKRFHNSMEVFLKETEELIENVKKIAGEEEAEILEGHTIIVRDPEMIKNIENSLNGENITAESAISTNYDMFAEMFMIMEDDLMQQRASDMHDIKNRLLEILTGQKSRGVEDITEESVIVCHDLVPSETGKMDRSKVLGIVTEIGGMTSHTAIISRAMEIPTVLSVKDIVSQVKEGDIIAVNGNKGEIIVNPNEEQIKEYEILIEAEKERKALLDKYKDKESVSIDGRQVELAANISGPNDLESVLKNTAEGVGLFRTELLFMDRNSLPSEEDQFQAYKEVAVALEGKPVIIRTLDIGGDKDVPYLNLAEEENPFLGYRAIRICLGNIEMFKVQIRALLRASDYGDIKIMLPMITTLTELRDSKELIEECKAELREEGISFNDDIDVGIMVETPASVVMADDLAKECDFFSIGTNDLTQYTMAVDRGNEKVQYLYSTFDPSVIRSIHIVIQAAKKADIMVGMCGEGAGDIRMIPFLLASGLDEFSMNPGSILEARRSITSLNKEELEKEHLDNILSLKTREEVYEYLDKLAVK